MTEPRLDELMEQAERTKLLEHAKAAFEKAKIGPNVNREGQKFITLY